MEQNNFGTVPKLFKHGTPSLQEQSCGISLKLARYKCTYFFVGTLIFACVSPGKWREMLLLLLFIGIDWKSAPRTTRRTSTLRKTSERNVSPVPYRILQDTQQTIQILIG